MNYEPAEIHTMLQQFMDKHLKPCLELYQNNQHKRKENISVTAGNGMDSINAWLETLDQTVVRSIIFPFLVSPYCLN